MNTTNPSPLSQFEYNELMRQYKKIEAAITKVGTKNALLRLREKIKQERPN